MSQQTPPYPPPIVTAPTYPTRPRAHGRVPRPWPVTIALALLWLGLSFNCVGSFFLLSLAGGMVATAVGIAPSTFVAWFYLSLIFFPALNFLFVWFLGWLFDAVTEYRVQIVAEGTARALAREGK